MIYTRRPTLTPVVIEIKSLNNDHTRKEKKQNTTKMYMNAQIVRIRTNNQWVASEPKRELCLSETTKVNVDPL